MSSLTSIRFIGASLGLKVHKRMTHPPGQQTVRHKACSFMREDLVSRGMLPTAMCHLTIRDSTRRDSAPDDCQRASVSLNPQNFCKTFSGGTLVQSIRPSHFASERKKRKLIKRLINYDVTRLKGLGSYQI
jgi:hypothetical protein